MVLSSTAGFRPRKRDAGELEPASSPVHKRPATELTQNPNYRVTRLVASPAQGSAVSIGYTDANTGYGVAVVEDTIQVWPYTLADPHPHIYQVPAPQSDFPLALVTAPAPDQPRDPGLVIINSQTGFVKFFESVKHAAALELIDNKHWEAQISLGLNEAVSLAEPAEPAGVIVATTHGRCFLVTLRDVTGKPSLDVDLLQVPSGVASKLWRSVWGGAPPVIHGDIVSVRPGRLHNQGMTQELVALTRRGEISIFTCQLLSSSRYCSVDPRRSFRHSMFASVEASIEAHRPGGSVHVEFFDVAHTADDHYLVLARVHRHNPRLMIFTVKVDATGALVVATHLLKAPDAEGDGFSPKLFLPSPKTTAFVTVGNSVYLADIGTSSGWEDRVVFRRSVTIIGYGVENATDNQNAAVVVVTQNQGVVRIERFPTTPSVDPGTVLKSHIEQGVFFGGSSELSFDVDGASVPNGSIIDAVGAICEEIMASSSPYMNALPAVSETLERKISLLRQLLDYCETNFTANVVADVIPLVYDGIEKSAVALALTQCIDKLPHLRPVLSRVCGGDIGERFSNDTASILTVFTDFIKELETNDENLANVAYIVVSTQYQGVYAYEQEIPGNRRRLWVFDTDLVFRISDIYSTYYNHPETIVSHTDAMVKYCQVLYFYAERALETLTVTQDPQEQEYRRWYNARKHGWIEPLVVHNLTADAIAITERFHDYDNLVYVINSLSEDDASVGFTRCFDTFGYPFAESVYRYFLEQNQPKKLVAGPFAEYSDYLHRFFRENQDATAAIAWVVYLKEGNYAAASAALVHSQQCSQNVDTLANAHTKLSIAKLAQVAAPGGAVDAEVAQDLKLVAAQRRLHDALSTTYKNVMPGKAKSSIDTRVVDFDAALELVEPSYETVAANAPLSAPEDVVNLLTLLSQAVTGGVRAYADAIEVAALVENAADAARLSRVAWLRILAFGDDWRVIERLNQQTDDERRLAIHRLTLYKVALLVNRFDDLYAVIDGNAGDDVVEQSLVDTTALAQPKLAQWVRATVEEAKRYK
ncbi:hypothetical protein DIURU_000983 [Diutina rugosa]|uniref:Nucleoporin Nup133/Nup155-like N-terminal domain-containing protein n=1 Tax=Diutina rugosa TaxID=5481 RepID=A0A642UVT4_DIURU|nr:uncharacterized protein DIURU_000983 [Diutina rugosa]KAA8906574.1 hypothetical protein DIURU_000983 [Diutina rugosa]